MTIESYCDNEHNLTHTFDGPAQGFVVTKTIKDSVFDIEGFVGFLPSDSAIYVVFRGTESLRNIVADVDLVSSSYDVAPECNCKVHDGFKRAANSVWN